MTFVPNPVLIRTGSLPLRTIPRKIMLHLPWQEYSIGRTAASPGSLAIAALAPVFCQSIFPTSVNACTSCFPRGVLSRNLHFAWEGIQVKTDWTESDGI